MGAKEGSSENKTIFVGNIPTDTTAELLHLNFSPFGTILDIQIPIDPQTRTNRNFSFITFRNPLDALDAIDNMHLNTITNSEGGRDGGHHQILKVNLARNHHQARLTSSSTIETADGPVILNDPGSNFNPNRPIWDDENWIKKNALKDDTMNDPINPT